jgi:hypothetical protein
LWESFWCGQAARCPASISIVRLGAGVAHRIVASDQLRKEDDVLKPQFGIWGATDIFPDFRIRQGAKRLFHNRWREHDLERRVAQEPLDHTTE